ncbi:MAG: hypothetical protein ETSY1_01435 [Candidatus Entotheonella factor]|uniref:Peptidase M28 domain-containing protein n=1 Tax=Entotheonella factor TaxID=1429438 RepID=W4LY72_ENTF1|nr:hypothetical protein [Candidatus Entotheonella palauensis]ETX03059.1 MAG: hypothetical protein ETSY1_01435 [Candidatus Entotheonella factor]
MKQFISHILEAYDAQGNHRTGTRVDAVSGEWLAGEIKALGFEPSLDRFLFNRIDIDKAIVRLNAEEWAGTPIFDGTYTTPDGVSGSLGALGSEAEIAVAPVLPNVTGSQRQAYEAARREGRYKAILATTDESQVKSGVTLINADHYTAPFGPPVLQLSSAYGLKLQDAVTHRAEATVIATVSRTETEAFNVGAQVKGQDASLPPLVVMTPRSGWWTCASERGGGLAAWLAILRALGKQPPRRDVWLIATTGHELGHVGLDQFLTQHPDLLSLAHAWIHLGANFAARDGRVVYQASEPALMEVGLKAFNANGARWDEVAPIGERPRGEARNIYDGGGRYVSLIGSNPLFHHPDDRWPDAVDLEKTARLVASCVDVAMALAQ